jgi:hypothetical protein
LKKNQESRNHLNHKGLVKPLIPTAGKETDTDKEYDREDCPQSNGSLINETVRSRKITVCKISGKFPDCLFEKNPLGSKNQNKCDQRNNENGGALKGADMIA